MARSPRGFSRGQVSSRRQTAWADGPGGTAITIRSSTGSAFVGAAIVPLVEGLTVIRIRGQLVAYLESALAVQDGLQGAFGIGIATLAAVTAGIASVPTPITEMESENWLYWTPLSLHAKTALEANDWGVASQILLEVDTKAMRKFPGEMAVYAAVEFGTSIGTATANIFFDSRALVKLP